MDTYRFLFYLCNPSLNEAIAAIKKNKGVKNCHTEGRTFPWVFYVWGGQNKN
jgi:hypothetical protein